MVPQDPQDETVFAPSLGVSSSLSELVTFARLQLNGGARRRRARRAGGAAGADAARRRRRPRPAPSGPQAAGLGWLLSSFDGRLVASAEGGLASGSSAVAQPAARRRRRRRSCSRTPIPRVPHWDGRSRRRWSTSMVFGAAAGRLAREGAGRAARRRRRERRRRRQADGRSDDRRRSRPGAAAGGAGRRARAAAARASYAGVYENRYYGRVTVRPGPGDGLAVRLGRGVDAALRALERRRLAGHRVGDGRRLRRARRPRARR